MSTLMDATQYLLSSRTPADDLRLADAYIRMWMSQPAAFVLPKDHRHLEPIINAFAGKLDRLHKYIRAVRDELAHMHGLRSEQYIEVQELFRMLEVRLVQQRRRERAAQVVAWLHKHHPKSTSAGRLAYIKRLEQSWSKLRLQILKAHRKQMGGRIPEDVRADLLDEFWRNVDDQIGNGDLPPYE